MTRYASKMSDPKAEASAWSDDETALRNAVIGGTAYSLERLGVSPERIAEARAWVQAQKDSKRDPARIAMIKRDAEGDTSGAVYKEPI